MGKWGTGLCENDEMLDWLDIMNNNLRISATDVTSWQELDYTKSTFKKLLKYTLAECKDVRDSVFVSQFQYDIETTNVMYNGRWEPKPLLYTYIVGKKIGYSFPDDYLNLVFFCCFHEMGEAASFIEPSSAMQYLYYMGEIQKSLKQSKSIDLYHVL